jgi:DEAD/DEAH box helicase domain-containing protein
MILGCRLAGLAEQTLGVKKKDDGLMAWKWDKEGRIDKIIEYCQEGCGDNRKSVSIRP